MRLYRTGVKTTQADGSIKSIALHQGSLDGACAVYSTIISLMCLQQINIEDVNSYSGNVDKRSPKGKFLKTMAQEISNTSDFNIKATAIRKDYIDRIYDNIHQNSPAILGISFNNQNFGHAIVCIGVEESDEFEDTPTKLFCIDPGFLISNTSYWNCMIMLPKKYDDNTELTYVVGDDTRKIMLDDVIVFD